MTEDVVKPRAYQVSDSTHKKLKILAAQEQLTVKDMFEKVIEVYEKEIKKHE